ncbi:MAG: Mur ligase family protein [Candidatus Heimdallarchaeota archaeon]
MSKIEIGYRILISNYGYYGSIGRPYVIYAIKTKDRLVEKRVRIEHLLQEYNTTEIDCEGSNSGIIDQLEHLVVQVHNRFLPVALKCLHRFINLKKLRRMDHENSIVLPFVNRVVTSKILNHVLDLINGDTTELLPEYLISEIQERLPDSTITKMLQMLRMKNISCYDTEDDSRLFALGEGRTSIVIQKRTVQGFVKFLKYPFPFLDIDEIEEDQWMRFNLEGNLNEENQDVLLKILEKDWSEFKELVTHGSIPKYLVTGTNGKTSTTRILAHIVRSTQNKTLGITSTSGIFVDGLEPEFGDFTGPWSARNLLLKPIDVGVFEVARGGLIREGVIFDKVDCSIITNIATDHIGLRGIDTVQKMAEVKSLVYQAATNSIVMDADEPELYQIFKKIKKNQFKLKARVKVWGVSFNKERLLEFNYGLLIDGDQILLMNKSSKPIEWQKIGLLSELRVSNYGLISFMNINATLALAAAISVGINANSAFQSLRKLSPDINNIPGRGNLFEKHNRWFMLDYGHNPHALKQIGITIKNIKSKYKINRVIFLALTAGDRRKEDLAEYGKLLSGLHIDEVIFKDMWVDRRGREEGEVGRFIENVMKNEGFRGKIFQKPDSEEAIIFAISRSNDRDLVYLCAEKSDIMTKLIYEYNFES